MIDDFSTEIWPAPPKIRRVRKYTYNTVEQGQTIKSPQTNSFLQNDKKPLGIMKLRKWDRLLISTTKITGGEGDRMRKYMIIKKSELENIKQVKKLDPIVLNDFPPFITGYWIKVSTEEVIFELWQENMDGTTTRVFRNETPQKIPLL